MEPLSLQIACNFFKVQGEDERNATFIFTNEDHTLGNSLRYILSKHPNVAFVGYSIPHPYEAKMHLRLQTTGPPAKQVLEEGVIQLKGIITLLKSKYIEALKKEQE